VARKEYLKKSQKELIAFNYRKSGQSLGSIAKFLGLSKMSVSRYKNYRISGATKDVHTMYIQKEQDVFQEFYDECKKGNRSKSVSLFLVHGKKGDKKHRYLRKFEKLPRYKNKSRSEIINDVDDIIYRNYQDGNDKIILPSV